MGETIFAYRKRNREVSRGTMAFVYAIVVHHYLRPINRVYAKAVDLPTRSSTLELLSFSSEERKAAAAGGRGAQRVEEASRGRGGEGNGWREEETKRKKKKEKKRKGERKRREREKKGRKQGRNSWAYDCQQVIPLGASF